MTIDCIDCGTIPKGRRGRPPVCLPCQLNRRLAQLLHDNTATPAVHLTALADHLRADPEPEKVLRWLSRSGPAELLTALANGHLDLTHDALHAWPRPIPARHLQHHLVACGLLPPADGHLLKFEAWLHRRLDRLTDHPHERLLRRFALWHQLPRLRADAAAGPLRATATNYAVNQFNTAHAFLDWLHTHGIAPDAVSQTDLDTWAVTTGAGHRHTIRGFFTWATRTSAMPRHLVLTPVKFAIGTAVTQQQRLTLLRHYLTNEALPLRERTAACLMLLYGQPISRIHRLHNNDLDLNSGTPTIRFGDPPPHPSPNRSPACSATSPQPHQPKAGCSPDATQASPSPTKHCTSTCASSASRSTRPASPRSASSSPRSPPPSSPTPSASTTRPPPDKPPTPARPGATTPAETTHRYQHRVHAPELAHKKHALLPVTAGRRVREIWEPVPREIKVSGLKKPYSVM
ncbi:hypothetical protein EDC02_4915 [Micromonospora sp. Llam0]|uniref:hypothetical protein n=1 Tax=Micromonospora sp. Llam0 TaxID=2485143 RepID=UPI000FAC5A78|nr:hypothetical protein [Micromonospora sp. Llam0]ROO62911.1 hypothetical protein EDC02_4915 [Micromonospora sp. Llam0]